MQMIRSFVILVGKESFPLDQTKFNGRETYRLSMRNICDDYIITLAMVCGAESTVCDGRFRDSH